MAWDSHKDFRTGYVRATYTDGRMFAVVQQDGLSCQWSVSRQRMQGTLRGSWWDRLGDGHRDTVKAAQREALDCLREHRLTKTAAMRAARKVISRTRPAYPGKPGWLVCAGCQERVVRMPGGFAGADKTMLADRLAEHLVRQCDFAAEAIAAGVKAPVTS